MPWRSHIYSLRAVSERTGADLRFQKGSSEGMCFRERGRETENGKRGSADVDKGLMEENSTAARSIEAEGGSVTRRTAASMPWCKPDPTLSVRCHPGGGNIAQSHRYMGPYSNTNTRRYVGLGDWAQTRFHTHRTQDSPSGVHLIVNHRG